MSFDASYYYTADDTSTRREVNELFYSILRSALDGDSASVDSAIKSIRSRGIPIDLVLQAPALTPCKLSGTDPTIIDVAVELGLSDIVDQVVRAGAKLNDKSEYLRRVFSVQPVQGYVLELAALRQDIQMVSKLIELGADARRGAPVAAAIPKVHHFGAPWSSSVVRRQDQPQWITRKAAKLQLYLLQGHYRAGKPAESTPKTESVSASSLQAVARSRAFRSASGYKAVAGVSKFDAALGAIKLLLDAGADPNAKGTDGSPPLHACTFEVQEPIARLLLAHGASARASNSRGWTAAHYVCSELYQSRTTDGARILQLLADHGADFGAVTETGKTPFDYLAGYHLDKCSPTVVALLLRSQEVLVSAPKAGLRDCRERVASLLRLMIDKERDAGKPLRLVGVTAVNSVRERDPASEETDIKERVEFEMQVHKDLLGGATATTRGVVVSRAASEASGSAADGKGDSTDSKRSPPAPGAAAAGDGDIKGDATPRSWLESELRARALAEKEKEKQIEERVVAGWASGGAAAASTRCCSALHKALMEVDARGPAVTAAVLRCLEEHLPWSGVTSGWRHGMALALSPRHRAVVRWRHAGRALEDRDLAWVAASEGRPMELARRLRLGKLAGALVMRGKVDGAGGEVTALEAARLGGHDECARLLEEAM